MNPLTKWERLKDKEIMEGGNPQVCIMGCDDYATFCGAVEVMLGDAIRFGVFGESREVIYHGVRLFRSRSQKTGIMFG